jgi:hypothetical protein
VTGVQTCALPIFIPRIAAREFKFGYAVTYPDGQAVPGF